MEFWLRVNGSFPVTREAEKGRHNDKSEVKTDGLLDLLKRISPVAWQHIHFLGHYAFREKHEPFDMDTLLAAVTLS